MNVYNLIEQASHPKGTPVLVDIFLNGNPIAANLGFREGEHYILDRMADDDMAMETYLSTGESTCQMSKHEYRLNCSIFD